MKFKDILSIIFVLSFFTILGLITMTSVQGLLTDGLVSQLKFEGNVSNENGINNGTISGSVGYITGKNGQAINCTGGYVQVADTNNIFDFNGNKLFTFSFWANLQSGSGGAYFSRDTNTFTSYIFGLNPTTANDADTYGDAGGNNWGIMAGNPKFAKPSSYNQWVYWTIVRNESGKIFYYRNGVFNVSGVLSTDFVDKSGSLTICHGQGGSGRFSFDDFYLWNRSLTSSEISTLYANNGLINATTPNATQTNITFYNQTPTDITSTTLFDQNVIIQYNISNRTGMNNSVLQYKVNHNNNCYSYTNGSCTFLNNTYYNSTTYTNTTQIFNWGLTENTIYHSNNNLLFSYFNKTHSTIILSSENDLYKVGFLNFSLNDNLNYFEAMATSTGQANIYYCNSSYSTGNPATENTCSQIFSGIMSFNHSHNQYSNHSLFVFSQNSSGYIGNVKATSTSWFVFKGSFGNSATLYYINNKTRDSISYNSITNGVIYIDNSDTQTLNAHIHQFSLNDDFIYRGCINKSGTFECTTEKTERIDESIFKPVGVQITSPNSSIYQQYINITYIISQHPNTPVVNNSYVNISLFNSTNSKVAFIIKNNLTNFYYWDTYLNNLSINQNYYLQFNITDTYNQTTTTTSDLFNFSTDSYIKINATTKSGIILSNFTINATDLNTSETLIYSSINSLIYVQTIQGNTYNLTIDASGYSIESYTKITPEKYNNHTFNLFTTNSFNVSFFDEITLLLLNPLHIGLEIISDSFAQNYTTNNGTLYFDLISPDDYVFRYKSLNITDYPERTYYVTLTDRAHIDLNLYLVNTTTKITINIKDQDDNVVSNAYIKILRYDITSNTYTIREIISTNVEGNAYFSGILNTEYYKFVIEYPYGVEVETTNPDYLRSTSLTLRINLQENPLTTYYNQINTYGTLTFNSLTNNFNFYYNDASNTATQGCLYVYKYVGNILSTTNTSCTPVGTSTGTILLGVINTSGVTYMAEGTIKIGTTEYILKSLTQTFDTITSVKTKNNFFFLTILLTIIVSLLFLWNITIALIVTPLPIFFMSLTGMIPISRSVGVTLFLVGITLAVVISKKA